MGLQVALTEFYPPQMYLAIFLIGMPGQYLFGVTPMTMAAVVTTFVCSAIYYAATGIFFFSDSHVPIAVFLGMTCCSPIRPRRRALSWDVSCTVCSTG
jgi:hypothetical protein